MIHSDWYSWHMTVLLTCNVLSCDPPQGARASAAKLEMLATGSFAGCKKHLTKKLARSLSYSRYYCACREKSSYMVTCLEC